MFLGENLLPLVEVEVLPEEVLHGIGDVRDLERGLGIVGEHLGHVGELIANVGYQPPQHHSYHSHSHHQCQYRRNGTSLHVKDLHEPFNERVEHVGEQAAYHKWQQDATQVVDNIYHCHYRDYCNNYTGNAVKVISFAGLCIFHFVVFSLVLQN